MCVCVWEGGREGGRKGGKEGEREQARVLFGCNSAVKGALGDGEGLVHRLLSFCRCTKFL